MSQHMYFEVGLVLERSSALVAPDTGRLTGRGLEGQQWLCNISANISTLGVGAACSRHFRMMTIQFPPLPDDIRFASSSRPMHPLDVKFELLRLAETFAADVTADCSRLRRVSFID